MSGDDIVDELSGCVKSPAGPHQLLTAAAAAAVIEARDAEIERLRAEVADAVLGQELARTSVADELASVLASRAEWIEHAETQLARVERLLAEVDKIATALECERSVFAAIVAKDLRRLLAAVKEGDRER